MSVRWGVPWKAHPRVRLHFFFRFSAGLDYGGWVGGWVGGWDDLRHCVYHLGLGGVPPTALGDRGIGGVPPTALGG